MDSTLQIFFNIAVAVVGTLAGWWMQTIWKCLNDLEEKDRIFAKEIAEVRILVAGEYVRRDEFSRSIDAVFAKLDRIEDKIDGKVDKGT